MTPQSSPVPIYGDVKWRGKCHLEQVEQASFFSRLRREYPDTWGVLAVHPRNEGQLRGGQFKAIIKHKAEGMSPGASDIIIPGNPAFVCEMKRKDITQSKWQDGQQEYLEAAKNAGCFACVALGAEAAWDAFEVWISTQK
jgi:hypothetical protein